MTDISKVVRFRCPTCGAAEHSRERRPNGNSKCVAGHSYPSRDAIDSSANRLESATTPAGPTLAEIERAVAALPPGYAFADALEHATPAEVDGAAMKARENLRQVVKASVAKSGSGAVLVSACTVADLFADYATLARQLAEAKAMLGQCYVMAGADTDGDAPERHAMDALRAVTDLRRDYDAAGEECYGRNGWQAHAEQAESQLAAANAELTNLRAANIAYASEVANLHGRAGLAESQLAEAARRLGEVEGLVGEWREAANGERDYYSDALRAAASQLEAALTKEPTK